jgi:hypothetical protein
MRKIIFVFAFIFSLFGCSNVSNVTPGEVAEVYNGDFTAEARVVFGDNEVEMLITKNGMSISISVTSPAELEGMGIEISDEHAKISYEGMEQEIKTDFLPEGTPFLLLEKLFDELSDPEDFTLSTENGNLTAKGEDFSAVLSAEDFSVISAKFPAFETEFAFSEFEFKSAG